MMAHASVASSKPKLELDAHADTFVVGDNCLVIHNHNRPVNVYSYDPKDGHKSTKKVNATVGYQDPQSIQRFILIINQAICLDGLGNNRFCPIQCQLNGVQIKKGPKFLAEIPSETTHAIELFNPFDASHPLSGVTSYFDVCSLSVTEYENGDIPKIHLTADEPR